MGRVLAEVVGLPRPDYADHGPKGDLRTHGIASKVKWHVVADPDLEGASTDDITARFRNMDEANEFEYGLDLDLALVPDEKLAKAMLKARSWREAAKNAVLGVDVSGPSPRFTEAYELDTIQKLTARGEDGDAGFNLYPGNLLIRVGAVFPRAYETLNTTDPFEMWTGVGKIWRGLPDDETDTTNPFKTAHDENGELVVLH